MAVAESVPEDPPQATRPLDAARRRVLGLPFAGEVRFPMPPLTAIQWADPEAVAARYVLVDTNYPSSADPAALSARRGAYATERLRADLATSSSGAAGLEGFRRQGAVFTGDVLGLATDSASSTTTTVTAVARRATLVDGHPVATPRIAFYRLTLVHDPANARWLVVDVRLS